MSELEEKAKEFENLLNHYNGAGLFTRYSIYSAIFDMFTFFRDSAFKIEKENSELKEDIKYLNYVNNELREKLAIAEEKIKKLEDKHKL